MPKRTEPATPTKAEIACLEPFSGLPIEHIVVPETPSEFSEAKADLEACRFVGFDTESKPTFKKGEKPQGPHVVQLTTLDKAYIFQMRRPECHEVVCRILESVDTVKVGFGLSSDRKLIQNNLEISLKATLDMDAVFRREGYRREIGVKTAIALLFNQKFRKSKSVTMSNWALERLGSHQLLYAANDAYAALKVFSVLNIPEHELPISG